MVSGDLFGGKGAGDDDDDQVASNDEYQIALNEGIDDESLLEEGGTRKFTITSYGADYTVDSLVKRMEGEAFRIPEFQRRFVWSQRHSSKFIESLLMGLPVPGIFLYKEIETNRHLVIDGQQRLRTLQAFYKGLFGEKKFRLIGVSEPWINKTYDDLDTSDKLKLDDSIVHTTIFQQDKPANALDSVYFVFERINTGGIRLSPQEIRNCISQGKFNRIVKSLNDDPHWRSVFGPENKRAKDQELIVRFFGLYADIGSYSRPMSTFLNDFTDKMNKADEKTLEALEELFRQAIKLIDEAVGTRAFRPVRSFNAAVFDGVMVGLARRLENGTQPSVGAVEQAYDALLLDADFRRRWERSTADEETVKKRMEIAEVAFASI
ncbi:DUF262 domain-containing protein [Sphingopyxis sp.]|uniref:DUF262 domain-containing protein n=1 Tax=Sphingopyxis sp. TaxID=1908224 RepID=UPI002FCA354D